MRIGNLFISPAHIVGCGPNLVYLNCPSLPQIEVATSQMRTIRTQFEAYQKTLTPNAPPGPTGRAPTANKATQKRRTAPKAHAGGVGTAA